MWLMMSFVNQKVAKCMTCGKPILAEIAHTKKTVRYCPFCGDVVEGIAMMSREEYERDV